MLVLGLNSLSHCGIPRKPYGLLEKKQKNHPVGDSVQAVNLNGSKVGCFCYVVLKSTFPKGHVNSLTHSLTIPKKVKLSFLKHLWNGIWIFFPVHEKDLQRSDCRKKCLGLGVFLAVDNHQGVGGFSDRVFYQSWGSFCGSQIEICLLQNGRYFKPL